MAYTGLWHFCVHLDSSLFFGTSFRPSRRRRAELTASPSVLFESKRSLADSSGLVIELDCTIRTFIRSLTAFLILASKGFIREGPRATPSSREWMLRESRALGKTLASIDREVWKIISPVYTALFCSIRVALLIIFEPRNLKNVSSFKTDEDRSRKQDGWR